MPSQQPSDFHSASQAEHNYLNYYGLTVDPFKIDPNFVFVTPALKKLLGLFNHLVSFSQKIIVLTGEKGVGKTAILNKFVQNRRPEEWICQMAALTLDTPNQMLREICKAFDLVTGDAADKEKVSTDLSNFISEISADSGSFLIVIDDAHRLKPSVLEMLLDLCSAHSACLHLILCGEPELKEILNGLTAIQKFDGRIYQHSLMPFTDKDCSQYLRALFVNADQQMIAPFTEADYLQLYHQSKGLPSQLNEAARNLLEQGVNRLLSGRRPTRWRIVSASLLTLSFVLVSLALVWQKQDTPQDKVSANTVKKLVVRPIERQPSVKSGFSRANTQDLLGNVTGKQVGSTMSDYRLEFESEHKINDNQPTDSSVESQQAKEKKSVIELKDLPTPKMIEGLSQATFTSVENKLLDGNESTLETKEKGAAIKPTPGVYTEHEKAILGFNPGDYTVQLFGSRDEQSVLEILEELPLDGNYKYFKTDYQGGPWYVLIYGNFSNREQAMSVAATLPAKLRPQSSWIRRISGIQKSLAARSED